MDHVCNGRLSLEQYVPLSYGNQTDKTTVYFIPYKGNDIGLYSGKKKGLKGTWSLVTIQDNCEVSVPSNSSLPFDIFAFATTKGRKDAKRPKVTTVALQAVPWSNSTTRATDLVLQDGVLVKSGATTHRYLGTGCTTTTSGECEDSDKKRFLWNYYHRDKRRLQVFDTATSWTSTSNAWQRANNTDANRVEAVIGVKTDSREANVKLTVTGAGKIGTAATASLAVAIGQDSTTTPAGDQMGRGVVVTTTAVVTIRAHYHAKPGPGYHYWQWLQIGTAGGTKTWQGTDASANVAYKNGITGWIEG